MEWSNSSIGSSSNGNGNRFVTPGLPFIEPVTNTTGNTFIYYALGSSSQEAFPATPSSTYLVSPTGGNPATVCIGAGYSNGINSRSNSKPQPDVFKVQSAYDSLLLSAISVNRRSVLLSVITTAVSEQQDFIRLETYLTSLPQTASWVHATLSGWLLRYYRTKHREPDAQRVRTALLARHHADLEVSSFVQLSDALAHLSHPVDPLAPPAPADVTALRQVAASGTASARVACPVARRYAPACPCRFFGADAAKVLAKKRNLNAASVSLMGAAYPNPVGEWVQIPYTLPAGHGPVYLEVRNTLGQLVRRVALPSGSGEARIGVGALAAGLYQVALVGAGQPLATQRLSVNH